MRTSKTVNGVLHSYSLDGSVIISESFADKLLIYLYDEIGISYNNAIYGAWVDSSIHRGFSREYNLDWKAFIKECNKLPSYDKTIEFGRMMAQKYGFDILF